MADTRSKPCASIDRPGRQRVPAGSCGETAAEFGRARVTTQDVLRALVDRLLSDKALAAAIRDDLGGAAVSDQR